MWSGHLRVGDQNVLLDYFGTNNERLVLKAEMDTCMRLLGVEKVSQLGPKHVSKHVLYCLCIYSADSC